MAKCPACRSTRVYKGYRPAPLPLRLIRIHEFLCENCNLQFRAFSLLPPRSRSRKGKKKDVPAPLPQEEARSSEPTVPRKPIIAEPPVVPPPPRAKLQSDPPVNSQVSSQVNSQVNSMLAQAASAGASSVNQPLPPKPVSASSEPTKPTIKGQWEMPAEALEELESRRRSHRSHQVCPSCGTTDTERRRRKLWEKVAFVFTTIRAYKCRICGLDFYARRKPKE